MQFYVSAEIGLNVIADTEEEAKEIVRDAFDGAKGIAIGSYSFGLLDFPGVTGAIRRKENER